MKLLLVALFLIPLAFAQTEVELTPAFPVSCKTRDGGLINWHRDLQKVSETATEVVFDFYTTYGTCKDGNAVAYHTRAEASVGAYRNGFNIFGKEGVEASLSIESDTEHRVRLTFDKTVLFKKKLERKLTFLFRPGIYRTYFYATQNGTQAVNSPFEFPWNVVISTDRTTDTSTLKFL